MSEVNDLFVQACAGAYDDEQAWEAVGTLRVKGSREVFGAAKAFLKSASPRTRARALDVLGQLGAGKPETERPYLDEANW